ncbi:hypothetical protein OAQ47_00970 [Paracoccaceae bacterium]|nr:hypothetical protein [Paracoccaceae bacterium]
MSQNRLPEASAITQAQHVKIAAPIEGLVHAIKPVDPCNMTSLARKPLLISIWPETVAQSQGFGMYLLE